MRILFFLCIFAAWYYCSAQLTGGHPGCEELPVQGMCKARLPRWFFNQTKYDCEEFFYGGCGGNLNNYKTKFECQIGCIPI
ncbi:hypothetical protein V1264_008158 [Littorina saxatilis]|uniref:BPTI/Kunitz inhibitor domain-containing protein n=1 Tax=Littorina saxatilis TaxID=31220 RepID=A0AAN9ASI4_9CAEN